MKILQTIGGFGAQSGGTSTCTYDLLSAIHDLKPEPCVDLLTPDVINPTDRIMGCGEEWIKTVPNDYRTPLCISSNMARYLKENVYDIYHTNGMWMHINHISCSVARAKGKPYLITPHGMLYPETLTRSYWKKWPMLKLWFTRDIRGASCIHVTCEDEMTHLRSFGYKGPVALIGNPVAVPDYTFDLFRTNVKKTDSFHCIAFLGRLHPRKKVENIIRGVSLSNHKPDIFIIGKGEEEYERFLKSETVRLELSDRVHFMGFLKGKEKFEKLANVDALFVPSDMENFGMIIPEALIVGTPVIASLGTPWKTLNTEHCGWWRDNSPESIAKVIEELYSLSIGEHNAMGKRGRDYILQTYASDTIAGQMLELYKWILDKTDKPDFVYD